MVDSKSKTEKAYEEMQLMSGVSDSNSYLHNSVVGGYEHIDEHKSNQYVIKQQSDNPQLDDDGQSSLVRMSGSSEQQNAYMTANLRASQTSQSNIAIQPALKQSEIRGEGMGSNTLDALQEEESPSRTEGTESPSPVKSKAKAKANHYNDPPLVINITYTQYELIHEVAQTLNLRTSIDEDEDWDIWFIDGPTIPALLVKMKSYQRTNHFPGMYALARKNLLAKNLIAMQKYFPQDFNFFPRTWLLPQDMKTFKEQFNYRKAKTFIIKPEASCQGKGIFLTRNWEWIQPGEHYVAQRYLHKPFLVDNLKFDLRIYVLITSVIPLRIFIYKEGLARFATQDYVSPLGSNLNNLCMHLTNYAINKESEDFIQNSGQDDAGHKRSLSAVFKSIDLQREQDPEVISSEECWQQLKELTVKTIIAGHNQIAHIQRTAKPQDLENQLCFQILGIDIFLDKKAKPWLIEVNQSPSFMTDSPLDHKVKKGVLVDSFRMLNLSWRRKNRYINNARIEKQRRLQGLPRASNYEKEETRQKKIRIKDKHELNNLGNFERIYPLQPEHLRDNEYNIALQDRYDELIHFSKDVWSESAAGGFAKKKIDPTSKPLLNKATTGSPERIKELAKKDTSNTLGSVQKKTIVKLHSVPNNDLATNQGLAGQHKSSQKDSSKYSRGATTMQSGVQKDKSGQKIVLKDQQNVSLQNSKSPNMKQVISSPTPNSFAHKMSESSNQAQNVFSNPQPVHQVEALMQQVEVRKDSIDQSQFVVVNGNSESVQSQQQRHRSLQKQIGEQMSHIQYKGEDKLVNDFKQMQNEMRNMNKSPEKPASKLYNHDPQSHVVVSDQNAQMQQMQQKLIMQAKLLSNRQDQFSSPQPHTHSHQLPPSSGAQPVRSGHQMIEMTPMDKSSNKTMQSQMKQYSNHQDLPGHGMQSANISPIASSIMNQKSSSNSHQVPKTENKPTSHTVATHPKMAGTLTYFSNHQGSGNEGVQARNQQQVRTEIGGGGRISRNDSRSLVDYSNQQMQSQFARRLGTNQTIQDQIRQQSRGETIGSHSFNSQQQNFIRGDAGQAQNKQNAGVAMSAQSGLNRKTQIEGLHSSMDPASQHQIQQMTHSATFDNYKRHVHAQQNKNQQQSSQWYVLGGHQPGSSATGKHPPIIVNNQESHHQQQSHGHSYSTGTTQRSLSHVVGAAGQNMMTGNGAPMDVNTAPNTAVYERAARQHQALVNQHLSTMQQINVAAVDSRTNNSIQASNSIEVQQMSNQTPIHAKPFSNSSQNRAMLPPTHGHTFSRSSQQTSTKYSQGADAGASSSSHYHKHLDKSAPNIGSQGKIIGQMDMMKHAQLPQGNNLPATNVFSPIGSPNPMRQQAHFIPQQPHSSAQFRTSVQDQQIQHRVSHNMVGVANEAIGTHQQRLSLGNAAHANGSFFDSQQNVSKAHHNRLPGPRKPAVEQLYENRLHLQKQHQQLQSSYLGGTNIIASQTAAGPRHHSNSGKYAAQNSMIQNVSASQQQIGAGQTLNASTVSNMSNSITNSPGHLRPKGNVNLRHPHGDHLVLQGLSINKGAIGTSSHSRQ